MQLKRFIFITIFLLLALILAICSFFFNHFIFISLSISFIIVSFIYLILDTFLSKRKAAKNYHDLSNIAYQIYSSEDAVFKRLPLGIIAYNDTYNITYANEFAKQEFLSDLTNKSLYSLDNSLVSLIEKKQENSKVMIGTKYYHFITNDLDRILYFFDITALERIRLNEQDKTLAIGFIKVDDLLDLDKSYDLSDKTTLYSQITFKISNYLLKYDSCFEQLDNGKYIVITNRKNLELMISDKFQLLNHIRDLAREENVHLTISFGIACYDLLPTEIFNHALNALDLALKRGGDQIVVNIEGEHLKYFGAKLQSLEKNSYVTSRLQAQELKEAITSSSVVLIMGHFMSDLDALGAMFAAFTIAKSSIKEVYIVLDPNLLEKTARKAYEMYLQKTYSKYIIDYKTADEMLSDDALLFIVDTQSPEIAMFKELAYKAKRISLIDHHRAGEIGFNNLETEYVETSSSSTVELITRMFNFYDVNLKPSKDIATVMLSGLVVDTNNFTFRTGSATFDAASILRDFGALMIDVRKILRDDLEDETLISRVISNVDIVFSCFAISVIEEQIPDRTILAKISERVLGIENIIASFTIGMLTNSKVAISARSLGDLNVQLIMEQFGGGGHLEAAAAELENTDIERVKSELIATLNDYLLRDEEDLDMELILLEDVKGKGKKNDLITVANGYGQFLVKQGLAVLASEENKLKLKENLLKEQEAAERKKLTFTLMKKQIEDSPVSVFLKVGKDNKGFGQITSKQVAEELYNQYEIDIDRKKIDLPTINTLGTFKGIVNLDKDIKAELMIKVLEQ